MFKSIKKKLVHTLGIPLLSLLPYLSCAEPVFDLNNQPIHHSQDAGSLRRRDAGHNLDTGNELQDSNYGLTPGFNNSVENLNSFLCNDIDGDGFYTTLDCGDLLDCDDYNAGIHPEIEEICDYIDNNCDGLVDEDVLTTYYADFDGDGFGDISNFMKDCSDPKDHVLNYDDCDDGNSSISPEAEEICDNRDNNCNYAVDESCECIAGETSECGITDIGECEFGTQTCDIYGMWGECVGYIEREREVCDDLDNDCDTFVDDGVLSTFYLDNDGDGLGSDQKESIEACSAPEGYVDNNSDCNDDDSSVGESIPAFIDRDRDGFGEGERIVACVGENQSGDYSLNNFDCNDLNGTIHPGVDETCDGIENNCDGMTDEGFFIDEVCYDGVGGCRREGTFVCNDDGLGSVCTAIAGNSQEEICDGLDNNCNGETDEGYIMPHTNCGIGACASIGELYCVDGEEVDSCTPGSPSTEICDGLDNDCDGEIDEGYITTTEICDGLDNDCNGVVDESLIPQSRECTRGLGECVSSGLEYNICTGENGWSEEYSGCNAVPGLPSAEVCDGLDNDCDGVVDSFSDLTANQYGECAGNTKTCIGGAWSDDNANYVLYGESCNNLDDDCNNLVDDGVSNIVTGTDVGECRIGIQSCIEATFQRVQDEIYPSAEICDGLDNDCNGEIDESYITTTTTCGEGACSAFGELSCIEGVEVDSCIEGIPASVDALCNNIDDDCDGLVDENYITTTTTCGEGACRSTGNLSCIGGSEVNSCIPGVPTVEVCDGLDNDCNSLVDDGVSNIVTGTDVGECRIGIQSCIEATFQRVQDEVYSSAEVCDGLDNNCDGEIDEGDVCYYPSRCLVGRWNFNEGSGGIAYDSSGNGHNGTINNSSWTNEGVVGSAMDFNGVDGMVTISTDSALDLTNQLTLTAWIKRQESSNEGRIICKRNDVEGAGYGYSVDPKGQLWIHLNGNDSFRTNNSIPVNEWTHTAVTFDSNSGDVQLYINGQLDAEYHTTSPTMLSGLDLQIGRQGNGGSYFRGQIDEASVHSCALTPEEIARIYNLR